LPRFSSLVKSSIQLKDFFDLVVATAIITFALGILSFAVLKMIKSKNIGLSLPMSIGNTGYLGYPIALLAWGFEGLSKAVIFDNTAFIILLTFGIFLIHRGKGKFKEILKAAPMYAIILGILFNTLNITTPEIILNPIDMIGAITIPAALIVLGYRLTEIKIINLKKSIIASLFKIIIGFLVALIIVRIFGITGITRNVIIILAAMPSAVMSMILCQKYKRDASLVASVVFITTIISVFSIPIILSIL